MEIGIDQLHPELKIDFPGSGIPETSQTIPEPRKINHILDFGGMLVSAELWENKKMSVVSSGIRIFLFRITGVYGFMCFLGIQNGISIKKRHCESEPV